MLLPFIMPLFALRCTVPQRLGGLDHGKVGTVTAWCMRHSGRVAWFTSDCRPVQLLVSCYRRMKYGNIGVVGDQGTALRPRGQDGSSRFRIGTEEGED